MTTIKHTRSKALPAVPKVGISGLGVSESPSLDKKKARNTARIQRIKLKMDELRSSGLSKEDRFANLRRELLLREGK